MQDLKYGVRMLVKSPGFSLVAMSLAGARASAPTPRSSAWSTRCCSGRCRSQDPQALVIVSTTDQRNPGNLPLSHLNFKDLRAQNAVFTDMAAFTFNQVNYSHGARVGADPGRRS